MCVKPNIVAESRKKRNDSRDRRPNLFRLNRFRLDRAFCRAQNRPHSTCLRLLHFPLLVGPRKIQTNKEVL
jgi:hypothetical protein